MIKDLKMESYAELSSWAINVIMFPYKKEAERNLIETKKEKAHTQGRRQHEDSCGDCSDASRSQETLLRGKEEILPWSLWRKQVSADILVSAQ